jgi:alanine racemase
MNPILEVNLQQLKSNYLYLKKTFPLLDIFAVIKSNAYGLGLTKISQALAEAKCGDFLCARLEEALFLRKELLISNIYVLDGVFPGEEDLFFKNDLTPIINSMTQFNLWNSFSKKNNLNLSTVLNFDIGLSRLGLTEEDGIALGKKQTFVSLDLKFIMAHLSCSYLLDSPINVEQSQVFQRICTHFPKTKKSLSASHGLFLGKDYHYNIARCGIAWTGCLYPPVSEEHPELQSIVTLKAKILHVKRIKKGAGIGYGASFRAAENKTIAVISIGFGNGFTSLLSNKYKFFLGRYELPILGYVSMDLITVDLTEVPTQLYEELGEVEVIRGAKDLQKMSDLSGISIYEILTNLGSNDTVTKIYTEV